VISPLKRVIMNMKMSEANVIDRPYGPKLEIVKQAHTTDMTAPAKEINLKHHRRGESGPDMPFKDWCMPAQPAGYIKPRVYDHL
jgi:hypothetical protein